MGEPGGIAPGEAEALARRYARALDRLDARLLRSCLCEDAVVDMGALYSGGPEGFVGVAMDFMGRMQVTRHVVTNTLYIGGLWESYVDAWHLVEEDGATRELMVRGRYLQRHRRQAGEWRIADHREIVDFGEVRAADTRWFASGTGMPAGRRDDEDLSYGN